MRTSLKTAMSDVSTVLIIDNMPVGEGKGRLERIKEIVTTSPARPHVEVIHFKDLKGSELPEIDTIIVNGSYFNASEFEKPGTKTHSETNAGRDFETEMRIIREARTPILAICFGHTLVAKAFGGRVMRNERSSERDRTIRISVQPGDELLRGDYVVDVNHRDYVPPDDERIEERFHIYSTSEDERDERFRYVQYMRHKNLPIYSVQFHPETHESMPDGYGETGGTFSHAKEEGERTMHRFLELI